MLELKLTRGRLEFTMGDSVEGESDTNEEA